MRMASRTDFAYALKDYRKLLSPRASSGIGEAAVLLNVAADAIVEGGELGVFTPSFLVHARNPS